MFAALSTMAGSRAQILGLYKRMLRESQKFTSYNYRTYAVRRIKDAFREHKTETDPEKTRALIKTGEENLEIIKRQVILSQLYKEPVLVIEGLQQKPK